jgi:hypothetical protein
MRWIALVAALGGDPEIVVDAEADWKADRAQVAAVLRAAAGELWKHVEVGEAPRIRVSPKGGPIVLHRRGPGGEFLVKLDYEDTYWSQLTYQFAHEFTHVLCGAKPVEHRHKWFEESLCEAASLFVLRRSAETWKTKPPIAGEEGFAPSHLSYAAKRLEKAALPAGTTLAAWYGANREALEAGAEDRPRQNVVAAALLPLLEAEPSGWDAVRRLNDAPPGAGATFADVLAAWRRACPERHRPFVDRVAAAFGP